MQHTLGLKCRSFLTCPPHSSPLTPAISSPAATLQWKVPVHAAIIRALRFSGFVLEQLHPCSLCGIASIFLTYKISYLLFLNLNHQTKMKSANGERLLIATHLDQSNKLANQQQVLGFAMPLPASEFCPKMLGQNHFAEPKRHVLTCCEHPKFTVQCTSGVALRLM